MEQINIFGRISLYIGTPSSGKSYLVKYLLYLNAKKFHYGWLFCPNYDEQSYKYLPDRCKHYECTDEYIDKIIQIQESRINQGKKSSAFVIIDDFAGMIKKSSKSFMKLISNYRHKNITLMLSSQYMTDFPPRVRACSVYTFIWQMPSLSIYENAYKILPVAFHWKNYREFMQFCATNLINHTCLCVVTLANTEPYYFLTKANNMPNFVLKY
jgi:hypothetical protein